MCYAILLRDLILVSTILLYSCSCNRSHFIFSFVILFVSAKLIHIEICPYKYIETNGGIFVRTKHKKIIGSKNKQKWYNL